MHKESAILNESILPQKKSNLGLNQLCNLRPFTYRRCNCHRPLFYLRLEVVLRSSSTAPVLAPTFLHPPINVLAAKTLKPGPP